MLRLLLQGIFPASYVQLKECTYFYEGYVLAIKLFINCYE